jgi:hypothetical protein
VARRVDGLANLPKPCVAVLPGHNADGPVSRCGLHGGGVFGGVGYCPAHCRRGVVGLSMRSTYRSILQSTLPLPAAVGSREGSSDAGSVAFRAAGPAGARPSGPAVARLDGYAQQVVAGVVVPLHGDQVTRAGRLGEGQEAVEAVALLAEVGQALAQLVLEPTQLGRRA